VKLIIGLGNPGIEYQFTPHNLGFLTIDRIANGLGIGVRNRQCRALTARTTIAGELAVLAKPETYMNLSGLSVRELVAEHQVDVTRDLIVVYDELDLPLMVPANQGLEATGFTVSIEAATGVTTGISAADRARTIQVAADPATRASDLVRPGHVFPLRARARGVLERRGQTEAAVDLTRLAGLTPGGVLCEVINDDGTMARGAQLTAFCRRHGLPIVTVEHIAGYVTSLAPAITAV